MLLKRLLHLPGKGHVIFVFLLLNVLCGEPAAATLNNVESDGPINLISHSSYRYSGIVLVAFYNLMITLQFHRITAAEAVVIPLGPIYKPVLNKTESLSMAVRTEDASDGPVNISPQDVFKYNRKRRRPIYSKNITTFSYPLTSASSIRGDGFRGFNATDKYVKRTTQTADVKSVTSAKNTNDSMNARTSKMGVISGKPKDNQTHRPRSSSSAVRKPKLLKEITMLNRQNCLAKLLCGVQVAQPPTKSSSAVNDYAYLVKAFFDRFSIRGIVSDVIDSAFAYEQEGLELLDDEEEDGDEDDSSDSDRRKKTKSKNSKLKIGGAALHKARKPAFEKYNPKYYEEYDKDVEDLELEELVGDDIPDFMTDDIFSRRVGKNMTHVAPFKHPRCAGPNKPGNRTRHTRSCRRPKRSRLLPLDINRVRKRRGIVGEVKRGFMGFFNPRFDKTAYLDKRQLDLQSTENTTRQLNIAEEIATRIRSPRQCRLLNWFGNTNLNGNNNQPNGMTTTITTITNTGGMVGNMERLDGLSGIPQAGSSTGTLGQPGSQVVTVIQQSPSGQTGASPTAPSTSSVLSNMANMGQSASSAMSQAGNVANHIGSTICPFNILELQELILKAQTAPFPHFLTTTAASPLVGAQAQQILPSVTTSSSTADTTTLKATQGPPSPSSTVAVVLQNPKTRGQPPYVQLYGDFDQQPTYHNFHGQGFPAPAYPTPFKSQQGKYTSGIREPSIIPAVGVALEDDEGDFDDNPYAIYEKNKELAVVTKTKAKPTAIPKWMTTTPTPNDDEFYSYNDALPIYSYGTDQQSGYKVTPGPPKPSAPVQNYIRQFHQPPIVFDGKKYQAKNVLRPHPSPASRKKASKTKNGNKTPIKSIKAKKNSSKVATNKTEGPSSDSEEDNSDEDNSGNSEESEADDEEGSDEASSATSGSGEVRSGLVNNRRPLLPQKRPPMASSQSVETSDEEDNSNEAEEKKEKGADVNEEEEEEEDDDEDSDEDEAKRSYEQNDFSKDRGGPPSQPTTTVKPDRYPAEGSTSNGGFLSQFFSSFSSLFGKDDGNHKSAASKDKLPPNPRPLSMPPSYPTPPISTDLIEVESEEPDDDDDDDSDENDEESENDSKPKPVKRKKKGSSKPNKIPSRPPSPAFHRWTIQQPQPSSEPTLIPVVIEESSSWSNPFKGPGPSIPIRKAYSQEDDSVEPHLSQNPVEHYSEALRQKHKEKNTLKNQTPQPLPQPPHKTLHSGQINPNNKYIQDLPISYDLKNWINDLGNAYPEGTRTKNKQKKVRTKNTSFSDESNEDDEESNESEEESRPLPPKRRRPLVDAFIPPEPID